MAFSVFTANWMTFHQEIVLMMSVCHWLLWLRFL